MKNLIEVTIYTGGVLNVHKAYGDNPIVEIIPEDKGVTMWFADGTQLTYKNVAYMIRRKRETA